MFYLTNINVIISNCTSRVRLSYTRWKINLTSNKTNEHNHHPIKHIAK